MDACWGHSDPRTGDCTHYKWVPSSNKASWGRCYFYKRRDNIKTRDLTETNYKCRVYALDNLGIIATRKKEVVACKSGGQKYYKPTDSCEAMCKANQGQPERLQFPVGVAIDTSSTQKDDYLKFFKFMDKINKAQSSHFNKGSSGGVGAEFDRRNNC